MADTLYTPDPIITSKALPDAISRPEVDFIGNAKDLSRFTENSIEAIYASHVLEHFYFQIDNELQETLKEWHRVLQPSGSLYISVPDLESLCRLYLKPNLEWNKRHYIMMMIFGGQTNIYDVHKVGFDYDILSFYLKKAGFAAVEKVDTFDLFKDCSNKLYLGEPISLNVIAQK